MSLETPTRNRLALPLGFELGNYTILRVLGQGGFGITYLAYDSYRQAHVVIKENMPTAFAGRDMNSRRVYSLSPAGDDFDWAMKRFREEALLMAQLNHPNIVRVIRVFKALGTAYYAMPYVGGQSLDRILQKEGPMKEERLRPLLCSLLQALQYLHDKELLHRDIKPANILLDEEGEPILIDFGAARQLSQHSQTVVESPGYTPFEQMQTHGHVGPWTDIYALGGTMYKLLTGKIPMRSTDRIAGGKLPRLSESREMRRSYSLTFLRSIDKALACDAEDRWQDAEEWLDALTEEPTTGTAHPTKGAETEDEDRAEAANTPERERGGCVTPMIAMVVVFFGVFSLVFGQGETLCPAEEGDSTNRGEVASAPSTDTAQAHDRREKILTISGESTEKKGTTLTQPASEAPGAVVGCEVAPNRRIIHTHLQ